MSTHNMFLWAEALLMSTHNMSSWRTAHKNICYGYSLEAPHRGTSNEYPQHIFSWRNKKNINTFGLKKAP